MRNDRKRKERKPPSDKGHKYNVLPPHPGIDCNQIGIHPTQQSKKDTAALLEYEWKTLCKHSTWRVFQNTLGPLDSILVEPEHKYSEWGTLKMWAQEREWKKLAKIGSCSIGALAFPILSIPFLFKVKQRASKITTAPDSKHDPLQFAHDNHADEVWIFLNGACTTKELQYANGMHLADIFKRKIHLLHNPTQGLVIDLLEWFVTKPMNDASGLAQQLGWLIKDYLYSHKVNKVVLVSHSQGTILCSFLIQYLIMEGIRSELSKLEVFTFGASATDFFQAVDPITNCKVPFYEHYANSGDYFARMGILHRREPGDNPVPGNVFVMYREGHLFGEHYLSGVQSRSYQCLNLPGVEPRLYKYLPKDLKE